MRKIDFEYGLFGKLRAAANSEWTSYVEHPFVKQLGLGTLPHASFKRFLTQDYLFLIHYARAYALLAYKSTQLADIRAATASLNAIISELPVHVKYCNAWGATEAEMEKEPEAPETMTYTRFVLDVGLSGDILDLMAALMPCIAGYGEIGQNLYSDPATVFDGNPYADWMRNYESDDYLASVDASIKAFDEVGKRRGADVRFEELTRIFATASRLEADFWQMGMNAAAPMRNVAA
jgi:thiaminase/transcriptional activator TenA